MSLHKEINFETEISEHIAANGWSYSPNDDGYDRARALFPEDVLAWVQEINPHFSLIKSTNPPPRS